MQDYPGDVISVSDVVFAVAGNKVLAAWPSRYCSSGSPNYSLDTSDPARRDAIAAYLGIDLTNPSRDDLYLTDMFGVSGSQGTVDYRDVRHAQEGAEEVKEVPFSCLWAARGTLEPANGGHEMVWRKAERLTSGARDVNRIEVSLEAGAGGIITWQEDPDGLRPGQGEGPGEGWSGAIANSQTDVWYSYIDWATFDLVQDPEDSTSILTLAEFNLGFDAKPQVGIPMAMPMRLTDNARCNVANPKPYCNGSAISALHPDVLNPLDYGMRDMCADIVQIPTGQHQSLADICVTEDGLPLIGNIAATRPRNRLFGYDSNGDGKTDSAWVIMEAEESKGMGAFYFTPDNVACEEGTENCDVADDGKNIWYYSFSMSLTDANAGNPVNGLVANLASHGNLLNQPEVDWRTGSFYPALDTADMWDFTNDQQDYNYEIYRTEIARRASLLAQPAANVRGTFATSGLTAMPSWKQGIMNQGGPADVMARRILLPPGYTEGVHNPYAFANMACSQWAFRDGSNPYYPDGVCLDPAVNLSSVIPDTCVDSATGGDVACPTVSDSGIGDTNPVLQGGDVTPNTTKVLTWRQCPSQFTTVSGETAACEPGDNNFTDQSWHNPLDVAKGHRGFLDGDFVMILYGWSPNWRLNAKGSDRYELYVRRSFDGGRTWTTQPANYRHYTGGAFGGSGAVSCETFRPASGGSSEEPHVCNQYAAGAGEQARNVTQLKSMQFTTLDPRYAPTSPTVRNPLTGQYYPHSWAVEDARDPSRFFIVYETGDNSTVEFGEAEPLDLYYGRASQFGDNYIVWAEEDLAECYPSDPGDDTNVPADLVGSGFCNEFDDLEGRRDTESSEASVNANPGGQFLNGVWAQAEINPITHELVESDAMYRRVWYIDEPSLLDLNGDGVVNALDRTVLFGSFGACYPNPRFNATADLDHDGCVGLVDLQLWTLGQ